MINLFKIGVIAFLVVISSCDSKNASSHELPSIAYLDSVCEANSDKLYFWTRVLYEVEKNLENKHDLEIKINRKVKFNYKNREYIIIPFFIKGSSNSNILMLHLLLLDGNFNLNKLKTVSFDSLKRIEKGSEYYYYN